MFKLVSKWLAAPVFPDDPEKTDRARLLNRVGLYYACLLVIAQLIYVSFFTSHRLESTGIILFLALIYAFSRWMMTLGRINLSMGVLFGATWLVMVLVTFFGGGLSSPFMIILLAVTVLFNLFLEVRAGLLVSAATVLIWLGLAIVQPVHYFNYSPISTWFLYSLILLFIQGVSHHILVSFRGTLEASRKQAQALQSAEAALRESELRFRSLSENSMTGIYVIQGGRLTYVNMALAGMLGYTVEELTGADPLLTVQPEDQAMVRERMQRRLSGELHSDHYEFRARRKDGSLRWCEVLGVQVELEGQPSLFGTMLDITASKQAEEAARRRTAELGALNEIGQGFSKLAQPAEILELLYTVIGRVIDNSNLYIALYHPESQYISFPVYTMRGVRMDGGGRNLSDGVTDYIIRTGQPLLEQDDKAGALAALGIRLIGTPSRSFMAVPVKLEERVIGVIALQDFERENVYDEHQLELLTTIASQAAVALENARLFQAVQSSEARFRAVVEHNHDGILMLDADRKVLYTSPSYTRLIGFQPSEVMGTSGPDPIHPEDQARVSAMYAALLQQPGGIGSLEYRLRHKDGTWIWVETTAANLLDEPNVGAVVLNSHEIGERKRAEEALRESEERYRLLVDQSPNAIVVHSQRRVVFINPAGIRLMGGVSADDFIGRDVLDFIHPDMRPVALERIRHSNESDNPLPSIENTYLRLDGQPVRVESSAVPFIYRGERAILSTIIDISERKRAEVALEESEERYRLLVDHSPNTIFVHSGGKIDYINPAGVRMMGGSSQADFIGRNALDFVAPEFHSQVIERMRAAYDKDQPGPPVESVYLRLDGQPVPVETSTVPFIYRGRKAVLGTITDITERKRAEESLQRHNAYLRALQETALDLISQRDLPTLLENITRRAGELVGTPSAYLDLVEPGQRRLVPTVGLGALAESLKYPVEQGESITGQVWSTAPMIVQDYDTWARREPGFAHSLVRR